MYGYSVTSYPAYLALRSAEILLLLANVLFSVNNSALNIIISRNLGHGSKQTNKD